MDESDGNLSDITDVITSGEDDSSASDDNDDGDVEMPDAPARQPNPWFSVIDRETFELNVNRDFHEEYGPCGFEANFSPMEYFEKFIRTEDADIIDHIVDETNR